MLLTALARRLSLRRFSSSGSGLRLLPTAVARVVPRACGLQRPRGAMATSSTEVVTEKVAEMNMGGKKGGKKGGEAGGLKEVCVMSL